MYAGMSSALHRTCVPIRIVRVFTPITNSLHLIQLEIKLSNFQVTIQDLVKEDLGVQRACTLGDEGRSHDDNSDDGELDSDGVHDGEVDVTASIYAWEPACFGEGEVDIIPE